MCFLKNYVLQNCIINAQGIVAVTPQYCHTELVEV